jgi:hypothetical protein
MLIGEIHEIIHASFYTIFDIYNFSPDAWIISWISPISMSDAEIINVEDRIERIVSSFFSLSHTDILFKNLIPIHSTQRNFIMTLDGASNRVASR